MTEHSLLLFVWHKVPVEAENLERRREWELFQRRGNSTTQVKGECTGTLGREGSSREEEQEVEWGGDNVGVEGEE